MRSSSSDHIITPAVTRFDPETADIPPSPTFGPAAATSTSTSTSPRSPPTRPAETNASLAVPAPPPPSLPHRPATCPQEVTKSTASPPSPQTTSLLARRRSSRSTARPDFLPKLDDLKLPTLPVPPLEELDDTVVPDVIGVGSQATTPFAVSPTSMSHVEEAPFRSTKTYASTPFPKGRRQSFFDESDDDNEDEDEDDDDEDGRSTAESSILDETTDGVRRLSATDQDGVAPKLSSSS